MNYCLVQIENPSKNFKKTFPSRIVGLKKQETGHDTIPPVMIPPGQSGSFSSILGAGVSVPGPELRIL